MMTAKSAQRVFIVDFDLVSYSGHYFNQVFGFREAARARGLVTRIYIPRKADPTVIEDLDAHALLPLVPWYQLGENILVEEFAGVQFALNPLWKDLETQNVSEHDILVITSSRPQVMFGLGQWLRARSKSACPAVMFRFLGPEFFNFEAKTFEENAWSYHFAARTLIGALAEERVFFTLNNKEALPTLEKLSLRRAFYLPVPKYYGPEIEASEVRSTESLTIYIHVNVRSGQMVRQILELTRSILRKHDGVNFRVRLLDGIHNEDAFDKELVGRGLDLLPAEQNHVEYLAEINRADMVLLPYDPVKYRGIVSGIFCEAVAMGKVAIIPDKTWMADHVSGGHAAGVLFEKNNASDMLKAVEQAIRERPRLQAMANRCAPSFRKENSCAANLDRMIELAGQTHDMRLSYVPLTDTTKTLGSQCCLGDGWSFVEREFGVWSDGDRAELNFTIRPDAKALVFSAQVLPFVAAAHPRIDVSVTANKVPVAKWSFDAGQPSDLGWSWRHAPIPQDVMADGEIQLALHVCSPASPKSLGMSSDARQLGLALRRFSLEREAPREALLTVETSPKLSTRLWRRLTRR